MYVEKKKSGFLMWIREYGLVVVYIAAIVVLGGFLTSSAMKEPEIRVSEDESDRIPKKKAKEKNTSKDTEKKDKEKKAEGEGNSSDIVSAELNENQIYSYLQGSGGWDVRADWSGSWCYEILGGEAFGFFGCGLCDLANIYSTLTPYDCSPLDMYYYAIEVSGYSPGGGYGAIDWPFMQETLETVGVSSRLCKKDETYEQFRKRIAGGITAVALVCSDSDDTYWQNVDGHYVNLWLYDSGTDTVFLADSGNMAHNRQRIPLRYVYDALYPYSDIQYLLVTSVDETGNQWKHDGVDDDWAPPSYYRS